MIALPLSLPYKTYTVSYRARSIGKAIITSATKCYIDTVI